MAPVVECAGFLGHLSSGRKGLLDRNRSRARKDCIYVLKLNKADPPRIAGSALSVYALLTKTKWPPEQLALFRGPFSHARLRRGLTEGGELTGGKENPKRPPTTVASSFSRKDCGLGR